MPWGTSVRDYLEAEVPPLRDLILLEKFIPGAHRARR